MKKAKPRPKSLFVVYTGHGKGKSTAAIGMSFRAMGWGRKVAFIQFIKGKWKTGENQLAHDLPLIDWIITGTGFTWEAKDPDTPRIAAQAGWEKTRDIIKGGAYDLIVLDEITYPINYGYLDLEDVAQTILNRPEKQSLVVTGRDAPELLCDKADIVSRMELVKHPFTQGIHALRGVDY